MNDSVKSTPTSYRATAWSVALILFAGICLRLAYWPELVSSATFIVPTTDASYHQHWARGLAFGDWRPPGEASADPRIPRQPFFRPPGYPYVLAATYRLFGFRPFPPVWLNMALDLGGAVLTFFLARRAFGHGPALVAGLLVAVYWGLAYFDGMLLEPALLFFLMAALLLACARWEDGLTWRKAVAAGLLTGLGALVRPNLLACVPVCVGWGLWLAWRGQGGWPAAARLLAGYLGAALLALAPAVWRNYRVGGEWPVLTTNGGINLYIANHPQADGMTSTLPPELKNLAGLQGTEWTSFDYPRIVAALAGALGRDSTAVGADRYFRRQAWDYVRADPRRALRNAWTKTLLFWGPKELANNLVVTMDRQRSRILRRGMDFPAVLATALLGLATIWPAIRARRAPPAAAPPRRGATATLILLAIAAYFASYLPFFIAARYRMAVVPFLLVFSGQGIWAWLRWLRARQYALAVGAGALTLAAYGLLTEPQMPTVAEAYLWHGQQARALQQARRYPEAAEMYRQAIALKPGEVALRNNLGVVLRDMGDAEGALAAFQQAVELGPTLPQPHANLAQLQLRLNRLDEAEKNYRAALRLRADRPAWWQGLGDVLARLGNNAEAEECHRRARQLGAAQLPAQTE